MPDPLMLGWFGVVGDDFKHLASSAVQSEVLFYTTTDTVVHV